MKLCIPFHSISQSSFSPQQNHLFFTISGTFLNTSMEIVLYISLSFYLSSLLREMMMITINNHDRDDDAGEFANPLNIPQQD